MAALRILLVDDEPTLLALLLRQLERDGHSVVAALSAEMALQALESTDWKPQLLIADQTLAGLSGSALAAALLPRFPLLVCLLCSGYPLSIDVLPVAVRSRAAMLQKPFLPAMLDRAIFDLLAANLPAGVP